MKDFLIPEIKDKSKTVTRRTKGLERVNENPDDWIYIGQVTIEKRGRLGVLKQANRLLTFEHEYAPGEFACFQHKSNEGTKVGLELVRNPYGAPGNLIFVKEAFFPFYTSRYGQVGEEQTVLYKAELDFELDLNGLFDKIGLQWFKPQLMTSNYARLHLENTGVHVERLQDLSPIDAEREGILELDGSYFDYGQDRYSLKQPVPSFLSLWDFIHGEGSADKNPWVFVQYWQLLEPEKHATSNNH